MADITPKNQLNQEPAFCKKPLLLQGFFAFCIVTPEGLEPPTDRTGICYSIQLNYGAFGSAKLAKISFRQVFTMGFKE